MARALFEGEPMLILKLSVASWFISLKFIFFRAIEQRLFLYIYIIGATLLKMCQRLIETLWHIRYRGQRDWHTSGKSSKGRQRVLATL